MIKMDMPNARLAGDALENEEYSNLRGRDYYCRKTMGYRYLSKEYRECKAGLRDADSGLSREEKKEVAAERKGGSLTGGTQGDWVTGDNLIEDGTDLRSDIPSGDPSVDAKDFGGDNRILGMEKPVAIPVIAISLVAITVGTIVLVKKLNK
jgi:hypothetical protein